MSEWSTEGVLGTTRNTPGKRLLLFVSEILLAWDFFCCNACATFSWCLFDGKEMIPLQNFPSEGWISKNSCWLSLAVAVALRDAVLAKPQQGFCTRRLTWIAEMRCLLAFGLLIGVSIAFRSGPDASQRQLLCWFSLFASSVAVSRWLIGVFLTAMRQNGSLRESVAVIGAHGLSNKLMLSISSDAEIVGVYNLRPRDQVTEDDVAKLFELWRVGKMDSVLIANDEATTGNVVQLAERLKVLPLKVCVTLSQDCLQTSPCAVQLVGGIPVSVIADRAITRRDLLIKTLFDKVGSLLLLIIFAPLLLSIALTIFFSSRGRIIFAQTRQGWCGRSFTVYKFRTMREPADGAGWLFQTERNDARCTRVGRFLRRASLDELPQLWNVLRGDMSLVGPRPHADYMHGIDHTEREILANYAQRNRVKPGMTGWAQIHGARGATTDHEQLRRRFAYDLFYIEHWSAWLDLQILARTAFCFFGENAY